MSSKLLLLEEHLKPIRGDHDGLGGGVPGEPLHLGLKLRAISEKKMPVIPPEEGGIEENTNQNTSLKDSLVGTMQSLTGKSGADSRTDGATGGPGGHQSSEHAAPKPKPQPQRRFLTRAGASKRKKQESTLMTAIHQLELESNPDNIQSHAAILAQMLESLELEHHEYFVKENLDINAEPESIYMKEFERKVYMAVEKQKKRVGIQAVCRNQEKDPGLMAGT